MIKPKVKMQYYSKLKNVWKDFSLEDYMMSNELKKFKYKIRIKPKSNK